MQQLTSGKRLRFCWRRFEKSVVQSDMYRLLA
jgi:hypothetical protein